MGKKKDLQSHDLTTFQLIPNSNNASMTYTAYPNYIQPKNGSWNTLIPSTAAEARRSGRTDYSPIW